MEINGVTFKDYALASANAAAGMAEDKIATVLGIEVPVWQDTKNKWMQKMAELDHDDMKFYGEVFMNPKQGRFANVGGAVEGPDKVLTKYPDSQEVGVDIDFQKEYGISITEFSQLGMHWGGKVQSAMQEMDSNPEKMQSLLKEQGELTEKWESHFKAQYKNESAGLSDDIDF